jgi:hypothetical protein
MYKTINYNTCLLPVFSSHLNWSSPGKQWFISPTEIINSKPSVHFTGNEFGLTLMVPNGSLTDSCKKYYAEFTLTRFETKANSSSHAVVVCDVYNEQTKHSTFYQSQMLNNTPAIKDSNSRTFTYEFEIPAEGINKLKLSFYIWNVRKEDFYITSASVKLFKVPQFSLSPIF